MTSETPFGLLHDPNSHIHHDPVIKDFEYEPIMIDQRLRVIEFAFERLSMIEVMSLTHLKSLLL